MYANQVFLETIAVLKALSAAAASARSEVQQLLVVLEGPAVSDTKPKGAMYSLPGSNVGTKKDYVEADADTKYNLGYTEYTHTEQKIATGRADYGIGERETVFVA